MQEFDDGIHPISFNSCSLLPAEKNYDVMTLQGRLILQVTWRRCSDPRDDTESC